MSKLQQNAQEARRILNALGKVLDKHSKAFVGSGMKVRGASKQSQPLDKRNIKAGIKRANRDDVRIAKLARQIKQAQEKRDQNLSKLLPALRSTREWLQFNYPEKNDPVRKLFEKELKK